MRRRLIIYATFFILIIVGIKAMDVAVRYDMSFLDYLKFSAPLTDEEKSYLRSAPLKYGIDVSNAPFAFIDDEMGQNAGIIVDYFN